MRDTSVKLSRCAVSKDSTRLFAATPQKCEGIPRNVIALQMSVMAWPISRCREIWPLVPALSGEALPGVEIYFQCAYLYGACLSREVKWSKIFPAIRPGNERLRRIKIPPLFYFFVTVRQCAVIRALQQLPGSMSSKQHYMLCMEVCSGGKTITVKPGLVGSSIIVNDACICDFVCEHAHRINNWDT